MLRSMLVGLDGSAHSGAAVDLGIRWARRFDALLVGLGIVDEPAICACEPVPMGGGHYKIHRDQSLLVDAHRRVDRFLEEFAERCGAAGVRCAVLEDVGAPDAQIVGESRRYDLTLLGQQTRFQFETQDWPDETLRRVLRQTARPVVTVPECPEDGSGVVVAYDGSPQADRALQAFVALGLPGEEEVHAVSIHADPAAAARLAGQAVEFLTLHGIRGVAHPCPAKMSVKQTVLTQVRQLRASLLVMGAYGRSMWQELVFGSTTAGILGACPVPAFLCR